MCKPSPIVSLVVGVVMLAAALPVWAHEGDDSPIDPKALGPGMNTLGIVALVVVVVIIWYQWRKRALLKSSRRPKDD